MSRLRIRHTAGFRYDEPVTASYVEARMLPASRNGQFTLFTQLELTPAGTTHGYADERGTRVTAFEVLGPHEELSLTASSLVEVAPRPAPGGPALSWGQLAAAVDRSVDLVDHAAHTGLTRPHEELARRAREVREASATPAGAAWRVLELVHEAFACARDAAAAMGSTSASGPDPGGSPGAGLLPGAGPVTAAQAWAQLAGGSREAAHIALGALREAGIPARYVSGYHAPHADAVTDAGVAPGPAGSGGAASPGPVAVAGVAAPGGAAGFGGAAAGGVSAPGPGGAAASGGAASPGVPGSGAAAPGAAGAGSRKPVRCEPHAWVEFWDGGWRGWDPVHGTGIGELHVMLARGRDHADAPPLRGVHAGSARSRLFTSVEIVREA